MHRYVIVNAIIMIVDSIKITLIKILYSISNIIIKPVGFKMHNCIHIALDVCQCKNSY